MTKNKPAKIILITTGDQDGIGPEITYRALSQLGPVKNVVFCVMRAQHIPRRLLTGIDKKFRRLSVSRSSELSNYTLSQKTLLEWPQDSLPPAWVEGAAKLALTNKISAIVNAPLSKTLIQQSGRKDLGHTDIYARLLGPQWPITMAFWGPKLSIALGTTHVPLKNVSPSLTAQSLLVHLENTIRFFPTQKQLRLGVVGLNPHAGEGALIGKEESEIFNPVINRLRKKYPEIIISDPLVPDVAFQNNNLKKYSVFFAPYHDQGLIPFKMLHGQSHGCQISLGLPFVRTSVDHGTAKELFGKNKANIGSMLDALRMAIRMALKTNA